MTAATDQAGLLYALAEHLEAHPDLPTVWIGAGMQIHTGGTHGTRVRGLIAWARSLDHPAIELEPVNVESIAPTFVRGRIVTKLGVDGWAIDVWCEIRELAHDPDRSVITVDELEQLLDDQATAEQADQTPATEPEPIPATREDTTP